MTKLTRKLWIALMHPLTAFFSAKLDSSLERAAPATKLAAELAGPDPDRRKLAAAQLSSLGLLALPALVAASRSKSLPARAHAVLLLGRNRLQVGPGPSRSSSNPRTRPRSTHSLARAAFDRARQGPAIARGAGPARPQRLRPQQAQDQDLESDRSKTQASPS